MKKKTNQAKPIPGSDNKQQDQIQAHIDDDSLDWVYVKVGTQPRKQFTPHTFNAVVVAQSEGTNKDPSKVYYRSIPTWMINGRLVGDYNCGQMSTDVSVDEDENKFKPVPFFENDFDGESLLSLNERITFLRVNKEEKKQIDPQLWAISQRNKTMPAVAHPIKAAKQEINVVVVFINECIPKYQAWQAHLQCNVDLDDDFADVHDWLRDKASFTLNRKNAPLRQHMEKSGIASWSTELLVMPQSSTKGSMYQWKEADDLNASDFLSQKRWGKHKDLYMEMHVLS